ncbi:16S rRNA (cytosine(1402)-N(4))-methyltransferase RsmH [Pseudoglutamicibacter cumminsii]|uniref:16S rRNA (cytosine(1402)-N(4))-methyltransferase RsmH n=1 Tax=Pseudoglutamicibacter cumminsii TaxID=156979 RepID=UPI002553E59A|nr:16S rRNA (cytosine(1402)-N(4))-methyltransferase RsmH [Pseudoglutamicibacter cumminsii]MDZ3745387.1 16S rRNA (cytosine(1402)-N(4))-methyltransferase RsmH [Pseudoglutamicibacter cumminsii]
MHDEAPFADAAATRAQPPAEHQTPAERHSAAERHTPVLLDRCLDLLQPGIDAAREAGRTPWVIDATLGMGGHTHEILARNLDTHVIGIDRDTNALAMATERLAEYGDRLVTCHTTYENIDTALETAGIDAVDGILFDLGVSSYQLDERERGFAYSYDAPLDMRMDTTSTLTAADVVNTYTHQQLTRVLKAYGEERHARRIIDAILRTRETQPFATTGQLAQLIIDAYPRGTKGGHPAKRTFQALRVEVNDELAVLEAALPAALDAVATGGRIVVMSYQSLEDRLVKYAFAEATTSSAPAGLPVEPEEHKAQYRLVTRGNEKPTPQEVEENSRAAAARLRAVERTREPLSRHHYSDRFSQRTRRNS